MFHVKHRSGIIIKVDENDDVYIKSSNIPLTLKTSEMWEEMEDKNGSKNS